MTGETLPLDALVQRCVEETEKFNRRRESDSRFCFELLRRALADQSAEALTRVYQVYERQVLGWVYNHRGFGRTGEEADYFAHAALSAFYFALRGPRFTRFDSLPKLLSYLKLCVHSAVAQYLRDQRPDTTEQLEAVDRPADLPDPSERAEAAELWQHICRLLPDADDQRLARLVFIQDLKPRQIVAEQPEGWASEREVTLAIYRLRRLLRADPELRRRMGIGE